MPPPPPLPRSDGPAQNFLLLKNKYRYHVYIYSFTSLVFAKILLQMTHTFLNLSLFLKFSHFMI